MENGILRWRHYYLLGKGITLALLQMQLQLCPEWTQEKDLHIL